MDKRIIFQESGDYARMIHDLFELNDTPKVYNVGRMIDIRCQSYKRERKLLVELLAFSLMPNHFHFLIRPLSDTALSRFIQKVGIGYTKYFNAKYERSGVLLQGKYRCVHINEPEQFEYVPYYVHANALDLIYPEWREGKLGNAEKAMHFLEAYRWSSFSDYIGKRNFPSVTQRSFLEEHHTGSPEEYRRRFTQWLADFERNAERYSKIILMLEK